MGSFRIMMRACPPRALRAIACGAVVLGLFACATVGSAVKKALSGVDVTCVLEATRKNPDRTPSEIAIDCRLGADAAPDVEKTISAFKVQSLLYAADLHARSLAPPK